jgi:hypothetical protein
LFVSGPVHSQALGGELKEFWNSFEIPVSMGDIHMPEIRG